MTRRLLAVDRLAALLFALLLICGGLAVLVWYFRWPVTWGQTLGLGPLASASETPWWPWAAALAGLVLIAVGIIWIGAHLRSQSVGHLRLSGSDRTGRLEADAGKATTAAADVLADAYGIRSARGHVKRDRGQLVAQLVATVEPDADLSAVAAEADQVSAQLQHVLGRDDLTCNIELKVAHRGGRQPRTR